VNQQLSLVSIHTDGGTQPRAAINDEVVQDYAFSLMEGQALPPVTVFYDGTDYWLADGFHRYRAAQQICRDEIEVEIRQGTRRDAVLYSVGANASHGLRRTNEDKRRAVKTLLRDEEWAKWSDREIARQCGVSQPTVSSLRQELRQELSDKFYQIESSPRLVERNGTVYTMNATNIGRSQPQEGRASHTSLQEIFQPLAPSVPLPTVYQEQEDILPTTEHDRYLTAVDSGTVDYYYDDLRREAFTRDEEEQQPTHTPSGVPAALLSSNSNEWYTPALYIDAVRELMGGIDLDPASCEEANRTVQATCYYSEEDDGLAYDWWADEEQEIPARVFLNPPYGLGEEGKSNQEIWSHRLMGQYEMGFVKEAVLLVNANTEAKWFQPLYKYLICLTNHRIRFYKTSSESSQPTQGNALVYFGKQKRQFIEMCNRYSFGTVIREAQAHEY
jgi:transposase-like protein